MRPFLNLGLMVLMGAALPAADGDSQPALQQSGAQSTPRGGPGSPRAEPDRRAVLRVDKTLISIPVAVSDAQSRFVTGLDTRTSESSRTRSSRKSATFRAKTRRSRSASSSIPAAVWAQSCRSRDRLSHSS